MTPEEKAHVATQQARWLIGYSARQLAKVHLNLPTAPERWGDRGVSNPRPPVPQNWVPVLV